MIVLCACAQGLVVSWHFTRCNMKCTRGKLTTYVVVAAVFLLSLLSRDIDMKQKRGLLTTYVAVTATFLSLLPLYNAMLKCCALAHKTLLLLLLCNSACKCTALAWWMAAAQTIFLWRCRSRLHIRLACQTLWWQQRKATLARLQYKQDCCLRAVLAGEQHRQAAAAWVKALAKQSDERHRQDALAAEQHCRELAKRAALSAELALVVKHGCWELAKCTAALVESVLAVEQCCQELVDCTAVLAEMTLANEHCCLEAAECSATLGETAPAKEGCCSLLAAQATESTLAAAQVVVLVELVLPKCFMAHYHRCVMQRWNGVHLCTRPYCCCMTFEWCNAAPWRYCNCQMLTLILWEAVPCWCSEIVDMSQCQNEKWTCALSHSPKTIERPFSCAMIGALLLQHLLQCNEVKHLQWCAWRNCSCPGNMNTKSKWESKLLWQYYRIKFPPQRTEITS